MSINLIEKLSKFNGHWSPKVICEVNDYQLKLAKLKGDFVWHKHDDTDELFLVISGMLRIDIEGEESVHLKEGELYCVKKGITHKPYAENECSVLLVEPSDVVNTGSAKGDKLTAPNNEWI
jgi:mannose-6-phosphate isomerase-like protein (cupin superfamily)